MKKYMRTLVVILCLCLFSFMAIASSPSSTDESDKTIVGNDSSSDAKKNVTIDEQVLVDQDGVKIVAKEYVVDSIWGDGVKLYIENNTDKNLMIGCTALIVNHYNINDMFATEVAAGMKTNETMYLSSSELEAAGVNAVGKIEVYFHIYDDDTWDDLINTECITIETSAINDVKFEPNDSGFELYNEDGIRIVGKSVDEDSFWGKGIILYVENSTDRNITVQVRNMSINGFMVSPVFSCEVYSERMAVDDITLMGSELEENGIDEIKDVSLSFHIFDSDSYDTIKDTDIIEFSAK